MSADSSAIGATARRPGSGARRCRFVWTPADAVLAALLVGAAVFAAFGAWQDIVHIALRDEEQSHVFLVPVVAGWLFWVRRERLRNCPRDRAWVGPAIIAAGWLLNRIGDSYSIQSFWHFGAVAVAVGAFLTVAGGGLLLRFLPVFAALCFLVPVPGRVREAIAIPLESATAQVTQAVLETLGANVQRSGNLLSINNQEVMIAEACNGLRMVFALVMVSFAFAYGVPMRDGFRALVIVLSPVTAIVCNVGRLVPTVWAFGVLSPSLANTLHDVSGWLMLPFAFASLLGVLRLLKWARIPISPYTLASGS